MNTYYTNPKKIIQWSWEDTILGGGEYYNSPCVMNIKWDYSYYQPWSDNE